jgi:photosynthetic reaction center H subunit
MSIAAKPVDSFPGAPLEPTGNPMKDGVGPAAWADRADRPDLTVHGQPKIIPMKFAEGYSVHPWDPDPRGMPVLGGDDVVAGTVTEIWVDTSEPQIRYLEVHITANGRNVLTPVACCQIDEDRRTIRVQAIHARHFADVPAHRGHTTVTLREEDQIQAYYAGGLLYASPDRLGPLL